MIFDFDEFDPVPLMYEAEDMRTFNRLAHETGLAVTMRPGTEGYVFVADGSDDGFTPVCEVEDRTISEKMAIEIGLAFFEGLREGGRLQRLLDAPVERARIDAMLYGAPKNLSRFPRV